jgi:hypothetical protein
VVLVLVLAGVGATLAVVLVLVLVLVTSAEVPRLVVLTCVDEDVAPELTCCMKTDKYAHIITTLLEQCRALHTTDMTVGGAGAPVPAVLSYSPVVLVGARYNTVQLQQVLTNPKKCTVLH